MKRKFTLLENKCPACGEPMIPDKYDFYICTGCGTQVCPPDDSKREVKRQILDAMAFNHLASDPVKRVKSHACGSKSGKRHKEANPMDRPTTTQLYNELAGMPNKIEKNHIKTVEMLLTKCVYKIIRVCIYGDARFLLLI